MSDRTQKNTIRISLHVFYDYYNFFFRYSLLLSPFYHYTTFLFVHMFSLFFFASFLLFFLTFLPSLPLFFVCGVMHAGSFFSTNTYYTTATSTIVFQNTTIAENKWSGGESFFSV